MAPATEAVARISSSIFHQKVCIPRSSNSREVNKSGIPGTRIRSIIINQKRVESPLDLPRDFNLRVPVSFKLEISHPVQRSFFY